jgi:hypothetical protein
VAAGAPFPAGLETHLGACDACRDELASLRQALALADAEMAVLLSAEPSPGLAARILRAVAEASPSPARRFGWLWPAMAAAATLLVALALWQVRGPVIPRDSVSPGPEGSAGPVIPRDSVSPGPEGSAGAVIPKRSPRVRSEPHAVRVVAPEVLVPPGEGEALLRLVALVHRERLSPAGLAAAGQPSPELAGPLLLAIEPLEIRPLDPAETTGTD